MAWGAIGVDQPSPLLSAEERDELRHLVGMTGQWVTYNFETGMFGLIDVYAWLELRRHE